MECNKKRNKVSDVKAEYSTVLTTLEINAFREMVYAYYKDHKRNFPWRENITPYNVLVSEIMLQQTQTSRVVEKFCNFITKFPSIHELARSSLGEVLAVWQGLGYNRRAKFLQQCAVIIEDKYNGEIPDSVIELEKLPGLGPATASAICAYAFNIPVVYIETNIRALYIHYFFSNKNGVTDKDLFPYVKVTLDKTDPARWYSALMDYGIMIKKVFPNPSRKSKHHQKQSTFEGSRRQLRGEIIRLLIEKKNLSTVQFHTLIQFDNTLIDEVLKDLINEEIISKVSDCYKLP